MRIAIDARMAREPLSGPGRYAVNLVRSLAGLDQRNQYVVLQDRGLSSRITDAGNFETIWLGYSALSLRTVLWLQNLLRKKRIDVFHCPYFLAPLLSSSANIITVHDLMALNFPHFFQGRSLPVRVYAKVFSHTFFRLSISRSSKIITDSVVVKNEVIRWKPEYEKKITVVGLAVDPCFRKITRREPIDRIRGRYALTGKIILYVGNTRPYKNLPRLIRAFGLLRSENPSCQLVIGGGESRNLPSLKNLVRNLGLDDHVIFTGKLSDEEVVALMNAADVFVFPSLYEGFGLPPLEAMACGTPVVSSNAGALPEILGHAALLANPRREKEICACVERVLTDEALRRTLVERGHRRVSFYSWEETGRQMLEVYKRAFKLR
jgi:glycosyltransferase involved in cell wall biosynthesis